MAKPKAFKLGGLNMGGLPKNQLDLFALFDTPSLALPGLAASSPVLAAALPQTVAAALPAAVVQALVGNYYVTGDRALPPTWADRAEANLDAIRLADAILSDKRRATREEQERLALFTGFGASDLANTCFRNPGETAFRKGWEQIGETLEGLVSREDYASLARSTQYAHFTPERIVRAIWAGLVRLGFRGGRVLEPGIGTGLFLSHLPAGLQDLSRFSGIEADPVTARIAGLLHPDAEIRTEDFGLSRIPAHFALAVGNPPYSTKVVRSDAKYRTMGLLLHDFFIVKALDHVVPGGLGAFVTSQGTLDKQSPRVRQHIATTSDLVGAIRLPEGTFKATAGTEVGVDILFLRKRLAEEASNGIAWIETVTGEVPGHDDIAINEYFRDHPEMVLGEHAAAKGPYGPDPVYVCRFDKARDLDADLAAAVEQLPQDISACDPAIIEIPENASVTIASNDNLRLREGSYFVSDAGVLMQVVDGQAEAVLVKTDRSAAGIYAKHARQIRALIPLRDAVRAILAKQERQQSSVADQQHLNELYDAFVETWGCINKTDITVKVDEDTGERTEQHRQVNLAPFRDDPDCWLVASIEDYDIESHTGRKGLIFTGTVIAPEVVPVVRTASDGLARSLHEHGRVEIPYIARLLDKSEAEVIEELDTTLYLDPESREWQTADEYLSGRVRDKLRKAVEAAKTDPQFARNVPALEEVQPTDIPPSDITARLGAPWIPAKTIMAFIHEVMGVKTKVHHVAAMAMWSVDEYAFYSSHKANTEWGTHRYSAFEAVTDALNARIPQIYDETRNADGSKTRELNPKETEAAKEKLANLRLAFEEWVWKDGDRADTLSRLYNDTYNNLVARRFDGSHLKLPGASASFNFYPHQKNAIWRMICGGTYVSHAVGAGKTASIAAAIMEQRRLGLITKAILTVPGHCLAQCAREFLALYPMAKILVADEQNFARDKRRRFLARAAMGDWDCIVITHSAFKFIPIPVAFERRMMEDILAEYEDAISNVDSDDRLSRKKLERMKESYKDKLESLKSRKDDFLTMSEIGIDQIYVDEAQEFRKLQFTTNQSSLKGIDPNGSQMAWDLYAKAEFVRYTRRQNAADDRFTVDRALNLASGTPITNTLGEMYTVQRFMDRGALEERNLAQFDAWAQAFGETRTELELQPSGKYKPVTRFCEFVNVPELIAMFRAFADVVSAEDLRRLVKRPRIETGRRQIVTAAATPLFKTYQKILDERIKVIEARKGQPQKGEDILLSVITDGRHAAMDLRFVLPGTPDEPENKLNKMIDNIHRIYVATSDRVYRQPNGEPYERRGATQMVFSDLGTPSVEERRGFSAYRWVKERLVALGVPSEEIAFVQDYKGSQAKNRLFADMRAGKVRVVLGSTKKMGTGVNAQNRLVALHHLDVPWIPSDIEQREGRIDRQGNQNEEIGIFAYATEGSMDATMWQANERKAKFIAAALSGDRSVRRLEDVGEDAVNQFAMAKAIASGDPRLMQKAGLESEISRLQRLRDAHYNEQHTLRSRVRHAERTVEEAERKLAIVRHDLTLVGSVDQPFVFTVGRNDFTERKDAGKALTTAMRDIDYAATSLGSDGIKQREVGRFRGCRLVYSSRYVTDLHFAELELLTSGLTYDLKTKSNTPGATAIGQIEDEIAGFERVMKHQERQIEYYTDEQLQLRSKIGMEFALEGELAVKRAALEEINAELAKDEEAEALAAAAEGEGDASGDDAISEPSLTEDDDTLADEPTLDDEGDDALTPHAAWLAARFGRGVAA